MTNKVFTGVVERVFYKEIEEPTDKDKEYGNKFKLSMEAGGEYFLCGSGKHDSLFVQSGGKYVKLEVGNTITTVYQEKSYGDKIYKLVKRSAINLISKGEGAPKSSIQPKTYPSSKPSNTAYESGIAVGHAVNNAVHILVATHTREGLNKIDLKEKINDISKDILEVSYNLKKEYAQIIKGFEKTTEVKSNKVTSDEIL